MAKQVSDVQPRSAAVIGGSGFIGSAVAQALHDRAWKVRVVPAPRLFLSANYSMASVLLASFESEVAALADELAGVGVVVNAAGSPNASSRDLATILGPNGALPVVVRRAAQRAGALRFVHISSSVVQGDREVLDSSMRTQAFSPYSCSKIAGERWLLAETGQPPLVTIYRPPSVHAPGRAVTRRISALAASPLATVAGRGERKTPQALLENVGDAVAFVATSSSPPPAIVHHPWEGLTTSDLMRRLGRRNPLHLPTPVARAAVATMCAVERFIPSIAPNRRRVELLWFGQGVDRSWLEDAGWSPPLGIAAWDMLTGHTY